MSEFMHDGVKRRSGRYKWGSGENPYQHEPGYNKTKIDRTKQVGKDTDKTAFLKKAGRNPLHPYLPRDVNDLRHLSDDALIKIINRLQIEKQYDEIINADYNRAAAKKQRDKEYANEIIKGIIKDSVNAAAKWSINTLGQLGTMAINKRINKKKKETENETGSV